MTIEYTPEQLALRDRSVWTKIQAVLAPTQFIAFIISVIYVYSAWSTQTGYEEATITIIVKISFLWLITITGMIWEKQIYGHYFLAKEFYWEDVGNAVAIVTHNLYFIVKYLGWDDNAVMATMLFAYATYLINCAQFIRRGILAGKQRRLAQKGV